MKTWLYKVHRNVAIWLAVPVMLWALSGILHPMMANWMRPTIASTFLPPQPIPKADQLLPPAQVFQDFDTLHQLKLTSIDHQPVYIGIPTDQKLHFRNAINGGHINDGAKHYSEERARAYLNDHSSPLVEITKITEFSSTYSTINRFLPVYRVKLQRPDGLEVLIDPRTGRLASFDNPTKRISSKLFSWFHTWSFLGKQDNKLRIGLVAGASILSLLVALSGISSLFFIKRKKKTKKARHWHRTLGALSALFFMMFGASGLAHTIMKYNYNDPTQWVSAQKTQASKLSVSPSKIQERLTSPLTSLSLAIIDDNAYYRITNQQGAQFFNSNTGKILTNGDAQFAKQLACEFSRYTKQDISKVERITQFRKDYGFIFKRLPVYRVHYNNKPILQDTVDTEDAHMAMRSTPIRLVEALSFTYLHKFHFMDFAGRNTRDIVSVIAALLVVSTTVLGIYLFIRKKRKA